MERAPWGLETRVFPPGSGVVAEDTVACAVTFFLHFLRGTARCSARPAAPPPVPVSPVPVRTRCGPAASASSFRRRRRVTSESKGVLEEPVVLHRPFLLALLVASARAEPVVSLKPLQLSWTSGEEVVLSVAASHPDEVRVRACNPLEVEYFDPEDRAWHAWPREPCEPPGPAARLREAVGKTGRLSIEVGASRFSIARILLPYGVDCEEGHPLDAARCREFHVAVSPNISIKPRAAP